MFTDWFYKAKQWLKQCFCHHEYEQRGFADPWYKCRKCGRKVRKPPIKLIKKIEVNKNY